MYNKIESLIFSSIVKIALFQFVTVISSFILYSNLSHYLDSRNLGLWFTIISFVSWFSIMDAGICHGLRNNLTILFSREKYYEAKCNIISVIYYTFIFVILFTVSFAFIIYVVKLDEFLNLKENISILKFCLVIVIFTVLMNILFSINNSIGYALQKSYYTSFKNMLYNVIFCVFTYSLSKIFLNSLILISVFFLVSHILANLITTTNLMRYFPYIKDISFSDISFKKFSENIKFGSPFLLISVSGVLLFGIEPILITKWFGPEYVSLHSINLRFFMIFIMLQGLYTTPLWSAYTLKNENKDNIWIKKALYKSLCVSFLLIFGVFIATLIYPSILILWIGNLDYYDKDIIFSLSINVCLRLWSSNFSTLLNGINLTTVNLVCSIISMIIFIPLSYAMVHYYAYSITSIILSSSLCLCLFSVIGPCVVIKRYFL